MAHFQAMVRSPRIEDPTHLSWAALLASSCRMIPTILGSAGFCLMPSRTAPCEVRSHSSNNMSTSWSNVTVRMQSPMKGRPLAGSLGMISPFDIIGDLAFKEPFGCLKTSTYHPWVFIVFAHVKLSAYMNVVWRFPGSVLIRPLVTPKRVMQQRNLHMRLTREKVRGAADQVQ